MIRRASLLLLLSLCSCFDEESAGNFRVATYNLGLAEGFVLYTPERVEPAAEAAANLAADAICLQEVWTAEDAELITTLAADRMPFGEVMPFMQETISGMMACTLDELAPLRACVEAMCPNATPEDLVPCVLDDCGEHFAVLGDSCKNCLSNQVNSTVDVAVAACTQGESDKWIYDGSFGLVFLARGEILASDALVMESTTLRRAVMYAHIEKENAGDFHVFCTHLTSEISNLPFPGEGSWAEENGRQVAAMMDWAAEKANGGRIILMGDMNTGPAVPAQDVMAENTENYDMFIAGGYRSAYLEEETPECTYCDANALHASHTGNRLIDHVLFKNFEAEVSAHRIFEEEVTVESDGETLSIPRSDHYGLLTTFLTTGE